MNEKPENEKSEKRILICEDDEGITELAQIVLEAKGYDVLIQSDSSKVFQRIEVDKPDLLLLDLWMPGLSGEEITRHLKADAATKHIPIIIMSANKDTASIAKQAGAEAFLAKPFDIDALEKIVETYLKLTSAS